MRKPLCIAHGDDNCMECIFSGAPQDGPFEVRTICTKCKGSGDTKPGASCMDPSNPPCSECKGVGFV